MRKKFKILISVALLVVIVFAATPKVYIHALLGHTHHDIKTEIGITEVSDKGTNSDCNFEKFDTPVYYTVFKFFLNFLPIKPSKEISFSTVLSFLPQTQLSTSFLRGPPLA